MSVNAGQGYASKLPLVHYLAHVINFNDRTVSLGWLPAGATVIGAGVTVATAFNAGSSNPINLGFRNSVQGATTDDDAYSTTDLAGQTLGHQAGAVTGTQNVYFSAPAEATVTYAPTGTAATAGSAIAYVTFVHAGNVEA